jgi:hypothetical protein
MCREPDANVAPNELLYEWIYARRPKTLHATYRIMAGRARNWTKFKRHLKPQMNTDEAGDAKDSLQLSR